MNVANSLGLKQINQNPLTGQVAGMTGIGGYEMAVAGRIARVFQPQPKLAQQTTHERETQATLRLLRCKRNLP